MARKKKNSKKPKKPSTTASGTPLADLPPEHWVPEQGWGEEETFELPADLLKEAGLSTENGAGPATALETIERPSHEPSEDERKDIRVGDTIGLWIGRIPLIIRLLIVITLLGVPAYGYGLWQRGELSSLLRRVRLGRYPSLTVLDAHGEYVLMVETNGEYSQVLVQTSPQGSWLRVSRDDPRAVNPALSRGNKQVAYLVLQDESEVVIAPLDDKTARLTITATDLEAAAVAAKTSDVTFCEWTPLAWNPNGHRLAFFGCRKEKPRSMAFMAQVDVAPVELKLIPDSEADVADPRQLRWSGPKHVVLSLPTPRGEQIKTLPVP